MFSFLPSKIQFLTIFLKHNIWKRRVFSRLNSPPQVQHFRNIRWHSFNEKICCCGQQLSSMVPKNDTKACFTRSLNKSINLHFTVLWIGVLVSTLNPKVMSCSWGVWFLGVAHGDTIIPSQHLINRYPLTFKHPNVPPLPNCRNEVLKICHNFGFCLF